MSCNIGSLSFIIMLLSNFFMVVLNAREFSTMQSNGSDEVKSLISFKKSSIRDDPKGLLKDWDASSSSPCSFTGVSCSEDGHVIELNLPNGRLKGYLHISDLMALHGLTSVNLNGNSFYGNLSSKIQSCSFEILDLSDNSFSEPLVADSLFSSCVKLTSLNLSRNSIPGGSLKFGPSLLQLDLSKNKVSDLGILNYSLSKCQNLKLLNLSNNNLIGMLERSIYSCNSLSILDLSNNHFTGEIPNTLIANWSNSLHILDLSHNNFTGSFNKLEFGNCRNLTVLSLSSNALSGSESPFSLANCLSLETLDLSHNALHMEIPGDLLGKFNNLKRLVLAHNQFIGEIPFELGQICDTLQELDLSGNQLTGYLPLSFTACSSLYSLNLGSNQLSHDFLGNVSSLTGLKYLYVPWT